MIYSSKIKPIKQEVTSMNKKLLAIIAALSVAMGATGCTKAENITNENTLGSSTVTAKEDNSIVEIKATINLSDDGITIDGSGATSTDNTITITSSGAYSINGSLSDGQIIIDNSEEANVYLVLDGISLTSSNGPAVYVKNAKNTIIVLNDNTENTISDGSEYTIDSADTNNPNAAIFSQDDLTIKGNGNLTVNGNYVHGINCKDDLKITAGNISVNSTEDGLRGKDSITVKGGNITLNTGGDGLKSSNSEEAEKGFITIEDGTLNITSGQDGIQAETIFTMNSGDITINSGGGSDNTTHSATENQDGFFQKPMNGKVDATTSASKTTVPDTQTTTSTSETDISTKGIKAASSISINGGNITIDSADDSIHCNDSLLVNNGNISVSSGDDGIHADTSIEINNGDIIIAKSYEGIESTSIAINGGNINLTSSDDGLNAGGGNDSSALNGRPGQNNFSSSNGSITIAGGYIVVNADGDGIDSNGSVTMSDGTVIVNGPTSSGNGTLDYDSTFNITGGTLIGAGSSGMLQTPSNSSSQISLSVVLGNIDADTLVHIENESGDDILTFTPSKSYQAVIFSSPELVNGDTYKIYYGGTCTGTVKDGLYTDGSYSNGTEFDSTTLSNIVNTIGTSGGSMMPGGNPGGMMKQHP